MRRLTPCIARRLAISRQQLAGPRAANDVAGILRLVQELGCLQLDPISAVARSHLLVLWSRLGAYDTALLDTLLWQERRLFEYWAHAASIVLTEDYPIHRWEMERDGSNELAWERKVRGWVAENGAFREQILSQIRASGPLPARVLESTAVTVDYLWFVQRQTEPSGFNWGRNVDRMLSFLWSRGEIMVAGREGGQKLWDLAERQLPAWTPRERWPEREVVRSAAQRSLRALGVATAMQIQEHFTRGRYPGLKAVLTELETEGRIERVAIGSPEGEGESWPGPWYIHTDAIPLLDSLERGDWQPRTTLLSPFDNLICDRRRTERLFDFEFRIEIYVPPAQRRYGYYVMPILHGDRQIGRIDPQMDRKQHRLTINAVHLEPDQLEDPDSGRAVAGAIEELAAFLGAREIAYGERIPAGWEQALRGIRPL